MEWLALSGALDALTDSRRHALWSLPSLRLYQGDKKPLAFTGQKAPPTTPGEVSERYDSLTYYLRGSVRCGECGALMTPKSAKGRGGIYGYYECMTSNKGGKCPIARVNAYALHRVALTEIAQVGAHPTRLDWLIRETVKTLPAPIQYREEAKALRKKEADIERRLGNVVRAISQGAGGVSALITESKKLEAEREKARELRIAAEDRAIAADGQRPDHTAVAAMWARFSALWEFLSEAERKQMLSMLVQGVTMTGKNVGELRLRVNCEPASNWDFDDIPPLSGSQIQRYRLRTVGQSRIASSVFPPYCSIRVMMPKGGSKLSALPLSRRDASKGKK